MKNNIKIISVIIVSLLITTINIFGFNKQARTNYVIADTVDRGISFNPNLNYGTVTDIDGNVYKTVVIGTQTWMAENLRTTKYRNDVLINKTTPVSLNIRTERSPAYQWSYDGNERNAAAYGRLYTWYAATDSRNVCPIGWHLPTEEEWKILIIFLGEESAAGGKLKEAGTSHWLSPNTGATNSSGFTALPGGYRFENGTFNNIGIYGVWWSSTSSTAFSAWYRGMNYDGSHAYLFNNYRTNGFSVRCIKDAIDV